MPDFDDEVKDWRKLGQLVAQMRKAQRDCFKSRKQFDLIASKRLETAVDMKLSELGIRAF